MTNTTTTEREDLVAVLLRLDPGIVEQIDAKCGGRGGGRGHRRGRSNWVEGLIYKELGLPVPKHDPPPPEEKVDLKHVVDSFLNRKQRLLVKLYRQGLNCQQIAEWLTNERVPTSKGGQWRKSTVHRMLLSIAKRAKKQAEKEPGVPGPRERVRPK